MGRRPSDGNGGRSAGAPRTSRAPRLARAGLAAGLALALACASTGRGFDVDSVPAIQRGQWTQADVRARFGEPTGVRVRGSGREVWSYRYSEQSTRDTATLARIVAFVARVLGGPFFPGPPVNVRTRETTTHSLEVLFDGEGVVTDYEYSRRTEPSREVY